MSEFELIERESTSMLDMARELRVTCDEQYAEAGQFVMGCKQLIAKIKAEFAEPKRKADEAHKSITAMEKRTLEPVVDAMDLASNVALDYKKEQDRLAKEERDRIEAERRRQIEEARLKEAEALEAKGQTREAEAVIAAPIETPRQTRFETPVPKVAGLSTKKEWKGKVVKPSAVTRPFCLPDQVLINNKVKNFMAWVKEPTGVQIAELESEIGGVIIEQVETFAGRVR